MTALASLIHLQALNLSNTRVSNVTALADLTQLQTLHLYDTEVM